MRMNMMDKSSLLLLYLHLLMLLLHKVIRGWGIIVVRRAYKSLDRVGPADA
jgi:hypothetical protein